MKGIKNLDLNILDEINKSHPEVVSHIRLLYDVITLMETLEQVVEDIVSNSDDDIKRFARKKLSIMLKVLDNKRKILEEGIVNQSGL